MRKNITRISIVLLSCLFSLQLKAQDPHFSQYFTTPHLVNPAFTSLFQGDFNFMLNSRSQWGSVTANPFQTISLAADAKLGSFRNCDYIGAGINVLADRAGDLNFSTVQTNLSASYFKSLSSHGNHYLSLGFSAGIAQRSLQVDPENDFLDAPEYIPSEQFSFFDLSSGLLWAWYPSSSRYFYAGAAVFHLNGAEQSHFASSHGFFGSAEPLHKRYVAHGGASLEMGEKLRLRPSFMFQTQGANREINFGSMVQFVTSHKLAKHENAVYAGVYYRWDDAIVLASRMDFDNFYLTMSYDINTSSLNSASNGKGGLEISLAAAIFRKNSTMCASAVDCPVF